MLRCMRVEANGIFADNVILVDLLRRSELACAAGIDLSAVTKCWICGRLTVSPIRLPDQPECPYRVCSHDCL